MNTLTFADPMYDCTFKLLFAKKENINLTKSLIKNLLLFDDDEIENLDILNPENNVWSQAELKSSVDIICDTKKGKKIIIEMQRYNTKYFLSRSQYYMANRITDETTIGMHSKYHQIDQIYLLVIANDILFNDNRYFRKIRPADEATNEEMIDNKMYWVFNEIPKYRMYKEKIDNKNGLTKKIDLKKHKIVNNRFEQWLSFLATCNYQKEEPENIEDVIKKSYFLMKLSNMENKERKKYFELVQEELDEKITNENKIEKVRIEERQKGQAEIEIRLFRNQYRKDNSFDYDKFKDYLGESPQFFQKRHIKKIQNKIQEDSRWSNWTEWKPNDIFDALDTKEQPFFSQSQKI